MNATYESTPYPTSSSHGSYPPTSPLKSPAQFSPAFGARETARTKRPLGKILLISVPIIVVTVGMALVLIAYVVIMHDCALSPNGNAIETAAPLKNLLAIPQILSNFVSKTTPLVISIYAYKAAARWLKANEERNDDRPSPSQLGILLSILQGGSIMAWIKARWSHHTRQSPRWPLLLSQALLVVGVVLFVSNLVTVFDTVLHLTSEAIIYTSVSPYSDPGAAALGTQLNATLCSAFDNTTLASQSCGLVDGGTKSGLIPRAKGLQTLSNSSDTSRIVFTQDQHAIIVPAFNIANVTYNATTYGVISSCESLTKQCVDPEFFSPEAFLNLNCIGEPLFNVTTAAYGTAPFGVVDATTGNVSPSGSNWRTATTNPFPVGGVVISAAYLDSYITQVNTFVGDTGFYLHGNNGGYNVMYCTVTVHNVVYKYLPPSSSSPDGTYTTLNYTLSSAHMSSLLAAGIDNAPISDYVPERVDGAGLHSGSYADAYALELSRELMAFSSMIYEPALVLGIQNAKQVVGSKVQIGALSLYVFAVLLYAILTGVIAAIANKESRSAPFVHLARTWVTSPVPYIHSLYGPFDPAKTWETNGDGFSTETDEDRLHVGPVTMPDGEVAFGVVRPPEPRFAPMPLRMPTPVH